jgi:methionyl aminopeptidase
VSENYRSVLAGSPGGRSIPRDRAGIVIKSERELARMREAGRVNARALAAAMAVIRPGVTTADVDAAAAEVLVKAGAKAAFLEYPPNSRYPFPAATTVSVNEELVHGIPGSRKLQEGDIVSVDCGTFLEGFVGDSAITVAVGEVSDEAQRLIDATYRALVAAIACMRPGLRTGDLGAAVQGTVEAAGFQVVREYVSHGVGQCMHEDPQVPNYGRAGMGLPLKRGMTIALEPMVLAGRPETRLREDHWTVESLDGRLTAHFEHTVAVGPDGPVVLTALDEDLDDSRGHLYNEYFAGRMQPASG